MKIYFIYFNGTSSLRLIFHRDNLDWYLAILLEQTLEMVACTFKDTYPASLLYCLVIFVWEKNTIIRVLRTFHHSRTRFLDLLHCKILWIKSISYVIKDLYDSLIEKKHKQNNEIVAVLFNITIQKHLSICFLGVF